MVDSFKARSALKVGDRSYEMWRLDALPKDKVARLPYSLKILLENLLHPLDDLRRSLLHHGDTCRNLGPQFRLEFGENECRAGDRHRHHGAAAENADKAIGPWIAQHRLGRQTCALRESGHGKLRRPYVKST